MNTLGTPCGNCSPELVRLGDVWLLWWKHTPECPNRRPEK